MLPRPPQAPRAKRETQSPRPICARFALQRLAAHAPASTTQLQSQSSPIKVSPALFQSLTTTVQVPTNTIQVPAATIQVPAEKFQLPSISVESLEASIESLRSNVRVLATKVEGLKTKVRVPKTKVKGSETKIRAFHASPLILLSNTAGLANSRAFAGCM